MLKNKVEMLYLANNKLYNSAFVIKRNKAFKPMKYFLPLLTFAFTFLKTTKAQKQSQNNVLIKEIITKINKDYKSYSNTTTLSEMESLRNTFAKNLNSTDSICNYFINSFYADSNTNFNIQYYNFIQEVFDSFITQTARNKMRSFSTKLKNIIYYDKIENIFNYNNIYAERNQHYPSYGLPEPKSLEDYEEDSVYMKKYFSLNKKEQKALLAFNEFNSKNWIVNADANNFIYHAFKNTTLGNLKDFNFELIAQTKKYLWILYNYSKNINHKKLIEKFPNYVSQLSTLKALSHLPEDFRKASSLIIKNRDGTFTEKIKLIHKYEAEEERLGEVTITYDAFKYKPNITKLEVNLYETPVKINDFNNGSGKLLETFLPTIKQKLPIKKRDYTLNLEW